MSHTAMQLSAKITIGLDLGDKTSRVYEVSAAGERVKEATIPTTHPGLQRYFGNRAPCAVVLEVGTHSPWVSRDLAALGHDVVVANPSAIFGARRRRKRNDRLDAEFLARQGRADRTLLYPIQHRTPQAQQHLEVLRARDQVVAVRSKLINHVRGAVKSFGARVRSCSTEVFARHAAAEVPEVLLPAVTPLLELIADLTRRIAAYDTQIAEVITQHHPIALRLQQPRGVGPITALAFVLLVEDPARFAKSRDVGAYFGLVPRLDESGTSQPQLRISKAGDVLGRRLLVSAAHYILGPFGPECDLKRHGEAICARGGTNAKKRAVVAVARKLAVLLHRLWVSEQPYDPDFVLQHRAA